MCRSVGFRKKVTQGTSLPGQRGGRQGIYEVAGQKLIRLQTEDCVFFCTTLDLACKTGLCCTIKLLVKILQPQVTDL